MGFLVILLLGLGIGSILGWISFFRSRELEKKVRSLELRLEDADSENQATISPEEITTTNNVFEVPQQDLYQSQKKNNKILDEPDNKINDEVDQWVDKKPFDPAAPTFIDIVVDSLRNHWMVWLGGVCIGLSGIFLVKYGIEQGLLGPRARITLGIATGFLLHCAAEWLRRREGQSLPSFAALAGGASIILYASLLAALHLYQLLNPGLVFFLLAVIAILTMLLALLHGPILAVLGLLGGYIVPIFVSDGSGNILAAMLYALIISAAGLLLIRYVYRTWLWFSILAGALAWWLLSLGSVQADGYRGLYLAVFTYVLFAIPAFDWRLSRLAVDNDPGSENLMTLSGKRWQSNQLSLLLIIIAQMISIAHESFNANAIFTWSPFIIVIFLLAHSRPTLIAKPWIVLVTQWLAWFYCGVEFGDTGMSYAGFVPEIQAQFLQFSGCMALLFSMLACWNLQRGSYSHWLASMMLLAPPLWIGLAYLLVTDLSTLWQWGALAVILGSIYIYVANTRLRKNTEDGYSIWLVLAGHFTYSIAMAMFFREATLTLALALQLITLAWLIKRFKLQSLDWLVKIVLCLVLLRLTFNPWILQYPIDIHWSLWTYGGATLSCFVASRLIAETRNLRQWLEAGTLQLLLLFIAAEVRYWLYGGSIFIAEYSLIESSINTALWSGFGLIYYYRSQLSTQLAVLYRFLSRVLSVLALISYAISITYLNPLWGNEWVAKTPVWNLLLAAYGLPVLAAYLYVKLYDVKYRSMALAACGLFGFIFINMEIRHLWQGGLDINQPVLSGELYTYSVVWLVMAIVGILLSTAFKLHQVYRAAMGLLIIVIAKVFFIDMSDLQGLLRVVSFMGLGLALLSLAYLHQRIGSKVETL